MFENRTPQERSPALDVIRCVACFTVVSVHFFNRVGFFSEPVNNRRMALMVGIRSASMICVPLFMILSGYLLCRKKPERSFYGKIWKTVVIYLLCGVACQIFRAVNSGALPPLRELLILFVNFEASPYGWYVEMYIGLFLLIPFLNLLYLHTPTLAWKRRLIGILILLTAMPGLLNCFSIESVAWWRAPASSDYYLPLIPDWWIRIYPITYYFIGCYLREYGCKLRTGTNLLLLLTSFLFVGLFNLWRSWGVTMQDGVWNAYSSILVLIPAVLLFTFFLNLKYQHMPRLLRRLFALCSELSLGAYLVSWIFDIIIYSRLNQLVPSINQRILYYPLFVPLVFVSSMLLSFLIQQIYRLLHHFAARLRKRKAPAAP